MTQPHEGAPQPQYPAQPQYPTQPQYPVQPQPTTTNGMARGFWIATLVCGCLGTLFLLPSLTGSAPQQAAGGAVAAAFVVIPYCMARAISELRR